MSGRRIEFLSGVVAPQGVWWRPANRQERAWIAIAFVWCLILFAMMPFWHLKGGQNPSGFRSRVDPAAFAERTMRFAEEYRVGEVEGIPVVAPPPGADVYLLGQMWRWYPALRLKEGVTYNFHLSALDVNHGFGLYPANINIQVIPGYDYGLKITPNRPGEYRIICNEFCGVGHHNMLGSIVVEPADAPNASATPTEQKESRQ